MSFSYLQIHNLDAGQGPEIHVDTLSVKIVLDIAGTSPAMPGGVINGWNVQAQPTLIRIRQGVDPNTATPIHETGSGLAQFPASGAWETTPISIPAGTFIAGQKLFFDIEWDDNGNAGVENDLDIYLNDTDTDADGFATPAVIDASQSQGAPAGGVEGSYSFDGNSVPADYASMSVLEGRMKIDSTQIKHRLHTADYAQGGYKPSMPATPANVAAADYKAFPAPHTVTALREAAEDGLAGASSTIPYVVEMDMLEAQLARLLDADLQSDFDGVSPVWKAESNSGSPLLTAHGDMDVGRDMSVGGDAVIAGSTTVVGNVDLSGDLDVDGLVDIGGDAIIQGGLDLNGQLVTQGAATFQGHVEMQEDLHILGNLDADGNVDIDGQLDVGGVSNLVGKVTVGTGAAPADLQVTGELDVDGSADFDVTSFEVDSSGKIEMVADSGAADAIDIIATQGDVLIKGASGIDLEGDTHVKAALEVDGNGQIDGALQVDQNATMSSILEVQGSSTLTGAVDVQSSLDVDGNLLVNGSATVEHELQVDLSATFNQDLTVSGKFSASGDLDVAGAVDIDASTFTIDATGDIGMSSDANITIDASAGILRLEGAQGVEFVGSATFEDDVTIKDQLIIENDGVSDANEPDFIIKHGTTELVHFDGSSTGINVEIDGDVTVGGSLIVTDAIEVNGSEVSVVATVSTMSDNIIEINKDNTGSHKSVGIELDGASSEKNYFFGIHKPADRFVLSRESSNAAWDAVGFSEDDKSDLSKTETEAATFHAGDIRAEGLVDIVGDLKVGTAGSETLHVDVAGSQVLVDGDLDVEAAAEIAGNIDVDGGMDVSNDLQIKGKLQVDYDGADYMLVVDDSAAGLSSSAAEDTTDLEGVAAARNDLASGVAEMVLLGDLDMDDARLDSAAVAGEFQAFGEVGLGDVSSKVRVFGEFEASKSAKFKESLRVHYDGSSSYDLIADDDAQQSGLSIASRALAGSSDAFLTLAEDKDMLLKGDLGVAGFLAAGSDIWFESHLKSKAEFLMQDSFTAGASFTDKDNSPQTVQGYVLAKNAQQIQNVLYNAPASEAIVTIGTDKHISIMGILAGLIAGGSTLRYESPVSGFLMKNTPFELTGAPVIHPNNAVQGDLDEYKDSIRIFHNGQRLSNDDYELVYDSNAAAGAGGTKMKFNFSLEEDDKIIMDINDTNPAQ